MNYLELKILVETISHVVFVVSKQVRYGENFADRGIFSNDDVSFVSVYGKNDECWNACSRTLHLPGGKTDDVVPISVSNEDFRAIKACLKACNERYKDTPRTETIKIQVGDKSAEIRRYILEPLPGDVAYAHVPKVYRTKQICGCLSAQQEIYMEALRNGLLFASEGDVNKFLELMRTP